MQNRPDPQRRLIIAHRNTPPRLYVSSDRHRPVQIGRVAADRLDESSSPNPDIRNRGAPIRWHRPPSTLSRPSIGSQTNIGWCAIENVRQSTGPSSSLIAAMIFSPRSDEFPESLHQREPNGDLLRAAH